MPRKTLDDQRYPFFGSRRHNQYPGPTVWGRTPAGSYGDEHPARVRALERWISKRKCDQGACPDCQREGRISRIRSLYSRRRR